MDATHDAAGFDWAAFHAAEDEADAAILGPSFDPVTSRMAFAAEASAAGRIDLAADALADV